MGKCTYSLTDAANGDVYNCSLPDGHDGLHVFDDYPAQWEALVEDLKMAERDLASEREARQAAETQAARLTRVAEDLGRARDEEHAALVSVMERLDAATQRAEEAELALRARRNEAPLLTEYQERIRGLERERDAARAEAARLHGSLLRLADEHEARAGLVNLPPGVAELHEEVAAKARALARLRRASGGKP